MGGGESKRVMTTALAALSAQLSGDSGSLGHDDGGTPQQHVLHTSSDVHNLMTMMMPTSSSPSPTLRRALSSTAPTTTMQLEFEHHNHHHHHHHHHAQAASFMSPSSPSDPSPLMDLRKAALLRSRFMKDDASLATNVSLLHSSSIRPPAGVEAATSATSTERREEDGKRKTDRDPSASRDTGEERKRPTEDDTVVDTNSIPSLLL
jgi:G3E family GTPase